MQGDKQDQPPHVNIGLHPVWYPVDVIPDDLLDICTQDLFGAPQHGMGDVNEGQSGIPEASQSETTDPVKTESSRFTDPESRTAQEKNSRGCS